MAGNPHGDIDRNIADTRHALDGVNQALAEAGDLAFRRVAEFDIKRHIIAADLQVFQRLGADKILARVGVEHALQRIQNCLLFYSHLGKSPIESDMAGRVLLAGAAAAGVAVKSNAVVPTTGV